MPLTADNGKKSPASIKETGDLSCARPERLLHAGSLHFLRKLFDRQRIGRKRLKVSLLVDIAVLRFDFRTDFERTLLFIGDVQVRVNFLISRVIYLY